MNKNVNLCELLKGHEGKEFYSTIFGTVKLLDIDDDKFPIKTNACNFMTDGKYHSDGEIVLFPSKDQRDWNKWAEEQKPKSADPWIKWTDRKPEEGDAIIAVAVHDTKFGRGWHLATIGLYVPGITESVELPEKLYWLPLPLSR